ncbi:MAG: ribosome biogenesis GTPase YlqF [Bacilli bacterium]|nr:ribosome biogenesis GTPase YlqF [Bacilli bacterium]
MNENKTNINWYPGHMAKTKRQISENLNLIDIVYEVIDARMPYSSKIVDIENFIKNKPRILIMTKSDLCDLEETKKWVKYYEKKGYYVILCNLNDKKSIPSILKLTDKVLEEKNKKRLEKGLENRRTRILITGIPNVGKSTLINRLVGKNATNVGNKPGVTKNLNWIRINESLELLDTPGILWPKFEEEKVALNLASLTAIKEEILPIEKVVCYIIETLYKYYPNILKERYNISEIDPDFIEVFDTIGKKRGCLIKGGEVDYDRVCSIVINDIKEGYIKGITFDRISDYE